MINVTFKYLKFADLIFTEVAGDNIDEILVGMGAQYLRLKDKTQPTCLLAPFIHPEVEAYEHSIFKRKNFMNELELILIHCITLIENADFARFRWQENTSSSKFYNTNIYNLIHF